MQLSLILFFTRQELIDRYSGSIIGGFWSLIFPLINILIFILVFSKIMNSRLPGIEEQFSQYGYSIYLVSGILAWTAFANTIQKTTNIFKDKAYLLHKIKLPLIYLPIHIILSESIIFFISMVFFILFLYFIDFPITTYWLIIPIVFFIQQLFAYALGLLFATLSVFIQDLREIVTVVVQLLFWLTPIVYTINIIPTSLHSLFTYNPLYIFIKIYRELIIYHNFDSIYSLFILFLISSCICFSSIFILNFLEKDVRDFI